MAALKMLTFIGAAIGALFVFGTLIDASAPQQAAAAAVALFFVVTPYCLHGVIYRSKRGGD